MPDEPDINLNPVFDKLGPPNIDLEDVPIQLSSAFNRRDQETDFDGNPLFIVVDHELATPDGIEGPMLTYVKPDTVSFKNDPRLNATDQITQDIEEDSNVQSQTSRTYLSETRNM